MECETEEIEEREEMECETEEIEETGEREEMECETDEMECETNQRKKKVLKKD